MAEYVLTAIGDDRAGLIAALSGVVADCDGSWRDSQFARLAGTFAGVVLVDIDPDRAGDLERGALALRETVGWRVEVTAAEEAGGPHVHVPSAAAPLRLHLVGQDRPGMIREVSAALASQNATIDVLRSRTSAMPEAGGVLFEAVATVRPGAGTDAAGLRSALEAIAAELMVDLDLDAESEFGEQPAGP